MSKRISLSKSTRARRSSAPVRMIVREPLWASLPVAASLQAQKRGRVALAWGPTKHFEIRGSALLQFETPEAPMTEKAYDLWASTCSVQTTPEGSLINISLGREQRGRADLVLKCASENMDLVNRFCRSVTQAGMHINVETQLEIASTIGKGGWGRVLLMKGRQSNAHYAVKEVKLGTNAELRHYTAERVLLSHLPSHNNIIKLWFASMRPGYLYFGMEFAAGGDLYNLLSSRNAPCTDDLIQFYGGEVLLALRHLHSHNIVYRDLKFENVLLSHNGHVKLGDLGMAKTIPPRDFAVTACGTDVYMPPEMVLGEPYRTSVDFWQFGAFIYELYRGRPPFMSDDKADLRAEICRGRYSPLAGTSDTYRDLIARLLTVNTQNRESDWQAVMSHPFFAGFDWDKLEEGSIEAPIKTLELQNSILVSDPSSSNEVDIENGQWSNDTISAALKNFGEEHVKQQGVTLGSPVEQDSPEAELSNRLLGFQWAHPELPI